MPHFQAILTGPKLPPAGEIVRAELTATSLLVPDLHLQVQLAHVTSRVGGYDGDALFFEWQENSSFNAFGMDKQDSGAPKWSLTALSKADHDTVFRDPSPALAPLLQGFARQQKKRHKGWYWLGGTAAVLVLGIGLVISQRHLAVNWIVDQISIENEQKLAKKLLADIKAEGGIHDKGVAVDTVKAIGSRLTQGSRYQYQWLVKKDDTINAFAAPGGVIVVHTGLLAKAANADELAAVLAHEVQHVEQRHSLKGIVSNLAWAGTLMVVLGDVGSVATAITAQLGSAYLSRGSEEEADRKGFETLVKAKIHPAAMVTMFQKMEQHGVDIPAWISSHPATSDRIKHAKKMLKNLDCSDCKSVDVNWSALAQDPLLKKS